MIVAWGPHNYQYYNVIQVNYTRFIPPPTDTAKGGRKARLTYVQMTFMEQYGEQIQQEERELMEVLAMVVETGII